MKNFVRAFAVWVCNYVISFVPSWSVRRAFYKLIRVRIGCSSKVDMRVYCMGHSRLVIGKYTHINQGCLLDARGGLEIGDSVSISHRVMLLSGSHDYRTTSFEGRFQPIKIGDYCWIGAGAIVLQGVELGRGAVVAAGAVVSKSVEPFSVVAGVPARVVGTRPRNLDYQCCVSGMFL